MKNDFNLVQFYSFPSLHTHKTFMRKCHFDMMKDDLFSVLKSRHFVIFILVSEQYSLCTRLFSIQDSLYKIVYKIILYTCMSLLGECPDCVCLCLYIKISFCILCHIKYIAVCMEWVIKLVIVLVQQDHLASE